MSLQQRLSGLNSSLLSVCAFVRERARAQAVYNDSDDSKAKEMRSRKKRKNEWDVWIIIHFILPHKYVSSIFAVVLLTVF